MKRKRALRQKKKEQNNRARLYVIGVVVLIAVVAVVVLILSNSQQPATAGDFVKVEAQNWPQADGKSLGPANATVVVKEFADYQCPYCNEFHTSIQKQIIADYVATGKVRFEYHHFIVIDGNVGGNESRRAAEASECAKEQSRFWDYHEILFANQQTEGSGTFSDVRLKAFAASLGLDTAKFNSCLDSSKYASAVTQDEAQGRALNINGTPSLFVNDTRIANPLDYASIKAAIDAALSGSK